VHGFKAYRSNEKNKPARHIVFTNDDYLQNNTIEAFKSTKYIRKALIDVHIAKAFK
jgi:hypothetical protein